jgi:hypothetical protein
MFRDISDRHGVEAVGAEPFPVGSFIPTYLPTCIIAWRNKSTFTRHRRQIFRDFSDLICRNPKAERGIQTGREILHKNQTEQKGKTRMGIQTCLRWHKAK